MARQNCSILSMMVAGLAAGGSTPAATGDLFHWSGDCATDSWYHICQLGWCDPPANTIRHYWNNWGRDACDPDTPVFPGAGDSVFLVDDTVVLDGDASVYHLSLNNNSQLSIGYWQTLSYVGPTLSNAGDITLHPQDSGLIMSGGDATLTGGGTVTLQGGSSINGETGSERLINEDNTIQGTGQLGDWGSDQPLGLVNRATILATGYSLRIYPGSLGVINSGTMRATADGTLQLWDGTFTNFEGELDGLVRADGGTVRLYDASVTGGVLDVVGDGEIQLDSSTISGATLTNSPTGVVRVQDGTSRIDAAMTNPVGGQVITDWGGYLTLESTGSYVNAGGITLHTHNSGLIISGGDVTLTGGGTVAPQGRSIEGETGSERLVNEDNTIQGWGQIRVATFSSGTILANGGSALTIWPQPGGAGFDNAGQMRVSGTGGLTINNAALFTNQGEIIVDEGRTLRVNDAPLHLESGALQCAGTVNGSVSNVGAAVSPGVSAGTLSIQGSYTQEPGGTFQAELGGLAPGTQSDLLSISGSATLAGTLELTLLAGFEPGLNEEIVVLTANGISGVFQNVVLIDFPPEQAAVGVVYETDAVSVIPAPDCNGNGVVDWQDILNATSPDCNQTGVPDECELISFADFDADGHVDLDDFYALVASMAGPDVAPNVPAPECVDAYLTAFDSDADGDEDLADFASFQAAFGGRGS